MSEAKPASDLWSRWLLDRSHGGNAAYKSVLRGKAEQFRDRVLDSAQLSPGMTLVDVGAGDGLVGFGRDRSPHWLLAESDLYRRCP